MFDTVECPYCGFENDMSDGLTDLPSDNKFDQECGSCEREFEVEVEFEPRYSSNKIVYENCEKCGTETRDICEKGRIFPYPKHLKVTKICRSCFLKSIGEEMEKEDEQND